MRSVAETIASTIQEHIPEFTDHSINHMDALWAIVEEILTEDEITQFTVGEAFLLGATFYVHDLGMATAATAEGREQLERMPSYASTLERLRTEDKFTDAERKVIALRQAARETHAGRAEQIAQNKIGGLNRFLIEKTDLRDAWGETIGKISASHNWSLAEVEATLGNKGRVPDAAGGLLDLGFLACCLRIVDYAHMNSSRAEPLDRALRSRIPEDNLWHWYAQERIVGPKRQGDLLVYSTSKAITDVDAWWIFYEMATGLDREITNVRDYLSSRACSVSRFSLEGVKGVRSPKAFATLVVPSGFEPVDVRFRPDSISRLVSILGGSTLYGNDQFAPIRELLQNARDAVHLFQSLISADGGNPGVGEIEVRYGTENGKPMLSVSDNGIGMNEKVVSTYLLGIAADFWRSSDFLAGFPEQVRSKFHPVGKFGIGFLSVFMIGDDVEVRTHRQGSSRVTLKLRGVGRRGSLTIGDSVLSAGTTVNIRVRPEQATSFEGLERIVRARAPMLDILISVIQDGLTKHIRPGWWKTASQDDLLQYVSTRDMEAIMPARKIQEIERERRRRYVDPYIHPRGPVLSELDDLKKWPGNQPESVTESHRIIATPRHGAVVISSRGFAIKTLNIRGVCGVVDVGDLSMDVSRSEPIDFDLNALGDKLKQCLLPAIIEATDRLLDEGNITSRYEFLVELSQAYGPKVLPGLSLPWITVLRSPGNTVLANPKSFSDELTGINDLYVTYSTNPWDAILRLRKPFPTVRPADLIVCVSSAGQSEPGSYRDEDRLIEGALPEHFTGEYSLTSSLANQSLLLAVISIVANAWGMTQDQLNSQKWFRRNRTLLGHLTKQVETLS
jgi:hypothetical protein